MMRWILAVLLPSVILFGACAAPEQPPAFPESPVPAHWATYTDDARIFTISYPPDWKIARWLIEDVEFQEYMQKAWEASGVDISSEEMVSMMSSMVVFLAGIPTVKGGYQPNVNVAVLPLAGRESKLDDVVEAGIRQSKELFAEYEVFQRIKTTVDGIEAVIKEAEAYYPGMGRLQQLQLIMLKDKVIWFVTCTSNSEEFAKYEDDFYHIVRSLRILK